MQALKVCRWMLPLVAMLGLALQNAVHGQGTPLPYDCNQSGMGVGSATCAALRMPGTCASTCTYSDAFRGIFRTPVYGTTDVVDCCGDYNQNGCCHLVTNEYVNVSCQETSPSGTSVVWRCKEMVANYQKVPLVNCGGPYGCTL